MSGKAGQAPKAYVEHLAATDDYLRASQRGDESEQPIVSAAAIRALGAVQIVGPVKVYEAASAFQNAMKRSARVLESGIGSLDEAEDARLAARTKFLELAQKKSRTR